MNGLYGIWCKLCALFDIIAQICAKIDQIVMNNENICMKIEEIVGDPNAECPDCPEPEEGGLVANEAMKTEAVKAVTMQIQETAEALKAQFRKTVEKRA